MWITFCLYLSLQIQGTYFHIQRAYEFFWVVDTFNLNTTNQSNF